MSFVGGGGYPLYTPDPQSKRDRYKEGYKKGEEAGYKQGKREGFIEGVNQSINNQEKFLPHIVLKYLSGLNLSQEDKTKVAEATAEQEGIYENLPSEDYRSAPLIELVLKEIERKLSSSIDDKVEPKPNFAKMVLIKLKLSKK